MLKEKIGLVIFFIGAMAGESENLIVPIAIMALGVWLMRELIGSEE